MRAIIAAFLLCSCAGFAADEASERAAVERTVTAMNRWPPDPAIFTADFDGHAEMLRLWQNAPGDGKGQPTVVISKEPWGEAQISIAPAGIMPPVVCKKIRFLTPEVALVDAVGKMPLLIVLMRQGTDNWKIASLRILAN